MPKQMRLRRLTLTSSKGLLDPPGFARVALTCRLAESAADWAAVVQEVAPGSAELASVVMDFLALGSLAKSLLLQPLAVNLVNAHEASDEIYIFLIGKRARLPRPGKLTR
jgi:hypothetical protein